MSIDEKRLSDNAKRAVLMFGDAVLLSVALWAALVLRYGDIYKDVTGFWWQFPVASFFGVAAFFRFGLYRAIVRYIGPSSMLPVIQGVTVAAISVSISAYLAQEISFPRSSPVIFWFIGILLVGGSRIAIRTYFYGLYRNYLTREPVAIYGAGDTGAQLAIALLNDARYSPVAFIDDDRNLRKNTIHGIRVYGAGQLPDLVEKLNIKQILLALPSATAKQRKAVLDRLAELPIHILTVPSFSELISGRASVTQMKEIEIGDLLGRDVVPPDPKLMGHSITGKAVLVTGAGGTIGSELCRKILTLKPGRMVLYDNSEYSLYNIEKELLPLVPADCELVVLLGSILNRGHLAMVLENFSIDTVYHAAAYKHVHMVERNVIEGVRNNVVGTWNVVRAAMQNQVTDFVLISSDKAVRPTNVMGASKRLAELIVQAAAEMSTHTRYCMVRFGNVLRSSGSVVPLFERQIAEGGPLEVTHKDATRYFMTASEAAELVIQAGALSEGGDVFVLDMGEPVKISELAEKMVHLHGKQVAEGRAAATGEIEIRYIGLRPGEKLIEELIIGEAVAGTSHPKIMKAQEASLPMDEVTRICEDLRNACESADYMHVKETLERHVTGYAMVDSDVDPLLTIEKRKQAGSNIMPFPKSED